MKPSVKSDFTGLERFIKGLEGYGKHFVKVGIMGADLARDTGPDATNAQIGAKHEFGSFADKIPQRSFLRMPIHQKQKEIEADVVANSQKDIAMGNTKQVLANIGVACETQIGNAFATGGFGQWKPLAPFTIEQKGHALILIESRQLERAISSKVESK